jgi:membrane protein YdbS with pleckstrin-like domain
LLIGPYESEQELGVVFFPTPRSEATLRNEPEERLDPRAKLLWRLTGALQAPPILAVGAFGSYALAGRAPVYFAVLPALGALAVAVLLVFVLPPLLWRRWRYEIRPMEVDLQRGLVRVTRTLVPMARVQHVDTRRGPLQRRLGLSTVVFYTAAGPNEIPQLAQKTAADVRDRISELTQSRDEL